MTDPFSVGSGAVGVVSLGLTVCQGLLQYYNSWKDSQKDVAAMCASLEGLTKTFRLLESTVKDRKFNQAILDRVTASIDLCEAGVDELDAKLLKVKKTPVKGIGEQVRGQLHRALYPFKESTLLKLRETISDLRDNLSLAISTLQIDVSATSLEKIDAMDGNLTSLMGTSSSLVDGVAKVQLSQTDHDEQIKRERRLTVIRWLSPLHFGDKQKDTLSGRQEGTGGWLLCDTRFTDWLEGKIRTLWCPGMPGAGKTVLASIIVDHLQQKIQSSDVAVAYIYCNYKEQGQTAVNLVASVAQQLAHQQPGLPDEISALYDRHIREETTPSLSEYSKILRSQIQTFSKLLIVIDALDECPDRDRAVLLDEMQNLSPAPYLLVTSRHIQTIEKRFREAASLEIEAKGEDIRTFLEAWLDQQVLCVRLFKADPHLREHILSTILTKSNGMFLLAVLHTNLLAGEDNKRDLLKALQNLPIELDDTYDQAMLRIEDQTRQQIKRAEQVLSWVTLAERPLTVKEMQYALAVAPGDTSLDEDALPDEDMMVSVCAGLVVIDQQKSIIRLVHYTTQNYLERTLEARYPHAQRNICATCISYLSFKVFEDGLCQQDRNWEKTNALMEKNVLLAYAAQNWGNHARKASSHDTATDELVRGFLGRGANLSLSAQIIRYVNFRAPSPKDGIALHIAAFFGLERTVVMLLREGHDINAKDSRGWSALHIAAGTEHENIVQLLLEKGADFEAKGRYGKTALHWAASAGREHSVRMLLEKGSEPTYDGADPGSMIVEAGCRGYAIVVQMLLLHIDDLKSRNYCAFDVLQKAASYGQKAVVKMILEGYADPEVRCRYAAAVTLQAAWNSHRSMLQLLLEYAHLAKVRDKGIQNALWSAASNGNESATRLLLDAGADPNQRSENSVYPIMHFPIENYREGPGNLGVLKMLVDAGGDIETTNSNGWTPLLLAAKRGSTEIMRFLLELGANVAVEEQETGRTALQWAAMAGDPEAVRLLLQRQVVSTTDIVKWSTLAQLFQAAHKDAGAALPQILRDADSLDPTDSQILMLWHLVAKQGQESALEDLLNMGVSLEAKDYHGDTALNGAAKNGHEGIVRLLLSKGANVDAESDDEWHRGTPLSEAARFIHAAVIRLLLEAGAKVETEYQRKTGKTPLNVALSNRRGSDLETIVQMLLEHGANTEIPMTGLWEGCTPLIKVARHSSNFIVLRLLLDNGASMEAKDATGKTALYHAVEWGAIDNIKLLLERGADPKSVNLATIGPLPYIYQEDYDEGTRLIRDAQKEKNAESDTASQVENKVTEGETELAEHRESSFSSDFHTYRLEPQKYLSKVLEGCNANADWLGPISQC